MAADDSRDGLEATVWRWLRDLYLRLLISDAVLRARMSEDERNLFLDGHYENMEKDLRVVMTFVGRGRTEGLEGWREVIHLAEADHEMLNEALDSALHREDD